VNIAVLVSGSGSILEAILAAGIEVSLVVSDRPCRGLDIAGDANIEACLLSRSVYGGFSKDFDRVAFSDALTGLLDVRAIELVAMAGFGTVLSGEIFNRYAGRILNTHPALLPAYPGWHAVEDALADGARVTGTTVHIATQVMDAGPIVAQAEVTIEAGDTVASLHERIKQVERVLYPQTISQVAQVLALGGSIEGSITPGQQG
jgi:phosphoribosylglycinamide formyltransferase-1